MAGFIALLYGALCYIVAFGSLLYAIGFVGDLVVPKTIDSGVAGPLVPSVIVNAILLGVFAVQHSLMARPAFKAIWTRMVPASVERSTYILFTSAALILLYWQWRPLPTAIWTTNGLVAMILLALFFAGWGMVLVSTFLISHFDLFGLAQVYARFRNQPVPAKPFMTPFFYKVVRHPIYLGLLIAFSSAPAMTVGRLLFAVGGTGYIFIGIVLEERDLVAYFGDSYIAYRKRVSMILPLPPRAS